MTLWPWNIQRLGVFCSAVAIKSVLGVIIRRVYPYHCQKWGKIFQVWYKSNFQALYTVISDDYMSFIWTFTKNCLSQGISMLPGGFEIHCIRQCLVNLPGKFHRSGGHSNSNCLQDRAGFHRWQENCPYFWHCHIIRIWLTGTRAIVLSNQCRWSDHKLYRQNWFVANHTKHDKAWYDIYAYIFVCTVPSVCIL